MAIRDPRSTPGITVMMPTFRRPASLERALGGIAAQADPGCPWDLVVIDNDDPPGAGPAVETAAMSFPVPIRLVREERRGSAFARNRGMAESSGLIVVMIDDDVVPAPEWLARLTEPILSGRCDGTGGRVVLDPKVARPRWFDDAMIGGYVGRWEPADVERDVRPEETIVTSNCAFTAHVLSKTEGFDPSLGPRSGTPLVNDDTLLTRRVLAAGGRLRFVPDALVVHELSPERLRRRELLRRAYAFGRSDWIMEKEKLSQGRVNGARVAIRDLAGELGHRFKEGIHHPPVAFHAAVRVARTAGSVREAVSWALERR